MKFLLIASLLVVSLFAEYPVAVFGLTKGEVYILRHGKLLKIFMGFKIDEYDTIYSRRFSNSQIIFNNNFIYDINGKQTISVKKLMDTNKILRVKTTEQIKQERKKHQKQDMNNYKYNSKFYKQRSRIEQKKMQKVEESMYIDTKRDIYIHSETKDISNVSKNKDSNVTIGDVHIDSKSDVKNIIINNKSTNINNVAKGHGSHSTTGIGSVHVK